MSALVIRRRSNADRGLHFIGCSVPGCRTSCGGTGMSIGRSSASHEAFILGCPAGALCERHAREWRRTWAEIVEPARELEAA